MPSRRWCRLAAQLQQHDDGPAATFHAAATMPNFLITEYF